jgi:hypothetical protein
MRRKPTPVIKTQEKDIIQKEDEGMVEAEVANSLALVSSVHSWTLSI